MELNYRYQIKKTIEEGIEMMSIMTNQTNEEILSIPQQMKNLVERLFEIEVENLEVDFENILKSEMSQTIVLLNSLHNFSQLIKDKKKVSKLKINYIKLIGQIFEELCPNLLEVYAVIIETKFDGTNLSSINGLLPFFDMLIDYLIIALKLRVSQRIHTFLSDEKKKILGSQDYDEKRSDEMKLTYRIEEL